MPIETGLWVVTAVIGSTFTFFSLKTVGKTMLAFSMLAVALWMVLAVVHAGGLEVSTTSTITDGTTTWTETNVFISEGTQATYLSWIFFGFAIFAMFNVIRSYGLINGL